MNKNKQHHQRVFWWFQLLIASNFCQLIKKKKIFLWVWVLSIELIDFGYRLLLITYAWRIPFLKHLRWPTIIVLPLHARWWWKLINLRALKGKHQCFSIFMTSTWAQKEKLTANFLASPSVNFFRTWRSCNHTHLL